MSLLVGLALTGCSSGGDGNAGGSGGGGTGGSPWAVDAGALKLRVTENPWNMTFHDAEGNEVLVELPAIDDGPSGSLGMHLGPPPPGNGQNEALPSVVDGEPSTPPARDDGWVHATEVETSNRDGDAYTATILTTDPDRKLELRAAPDPNVSGTIQIEVRPLSEGGVQALGIGFVLEEDERLVGFGERSNAVDQHGMDLEHYVADGPYYDGQEYAVMQDVLPPAGTRWRPDTTYFPIPWMLSSRAYGVLIDNDEISYHRLGSDSDEAWSMEVETHELRFRVFGGAEPADALRAYSEAVGRQPNDYGPWFFGPWLQSDSDDRIEQFRTDDIPTSLNATYLHYLPCGSQQGQEDAQRERTAANHDMGVAIHTYFNPMICVSYEPAFSISEGMDALIKDGDGNTYIYDYSSNLGNSFEVSQFDFAAENGVAAYKALTDEAIEHGYDGWMEDFGEYTPLDALSADGATGTQFHNRYVRDYHCGAYEATLDAGKPLARFVRSGWTGSPACSPIVWGGDPTTGWDYDGIESSMFRALSMGTSGVGIWGSDIGGFFAMFGRLLSDELFDRWIAYGGLSVVMRSQKNGVKLTPHDRPQPWDEDHQPVWRLYSKLHTQLYPYIQAAAEEYYATGRPIMQHHVLTHPNDADATARDDQYMFGPHILVAPVYTEGATDRELYLPEGQWVDWWRSVTYGESVGTFTLTGTFMHDGARSVTVDAAIPEIPMFVEAGAIIPMLWADVFTLAEYGDDPGIIHASDRDQLLHVLAFPRGETSGKFYDDGTWTSVEEDINWTLTIENDRERTIQLEATMNTRIKPVQVCGVSLDGEPLDEADWSFDETTAILGVTYTTTSGELLVTGC
jgi:alpha-glucosidase (family GH31 glycosyl hydrolase)